MVFGHSPYLWETFTLRRYFTRAALLLRRRILFSLGSGRSHKLLLSR